MFKFLKSTAVFTILFIYSTSAFSGNTIDENKKIKVILSFFGAIKSIEKYKKSFENLLNKEFGDKISDSFSKSDFVKYMVEREVRLYKKEYSSEEIELQYQFFYSIYPKIKASKMSGKKPEFSENEQKILKNISENRRSYQLKTKKVIDSVLLTQAEYMKNFFSEYLNDELFKKKFNSLFTKKCKLAYQKNIYQIAFVACSLVENGCNDCKLKIAYMHQYGRKVPVNKPLALSMFEKMAKSGNSEAAKNAGMLLLNEYQDPKSKEAQKGLFWLMLHIEKSKSNSWMAKAQLKRFEGAFTRLYSKDDINSKYIEFKKENNL